MLLYVVCTAGEFVWNEGGVVPATCYLRLISRCVIFCIYLSISIHICGSVGYNILYSHIFQGDTLDKSAGDIDKWPPL